MVGERIMQAREKNQLTQSALAKRLGLSRSAVNAWEMGLSVPSARYLVELSRLLKVSTDYLLGLERKEMIDVSGLDAKEKQVVYTLLNCFEERRKRDDP